MEYLLILGCLLVLAGVVGSFIPVLPGPAFSFLALLILYFVKGADIMSIQTLFLFGFMMIILAILDYLAPIVGAKTFGATKKGLVGAFIGSILGVFFFPPLGIFFGSFLGAVVAETLNGKILKDALRAGVGTFLGSMAVIVLQVFFSVFVAIYFMIKLIYILS